ncbi:MAG: bifunctional oligoribonuclease/PAP phosphatase NrnA [bacterium]
MDDKNLYQQSFNDIKKAENILILTHKNPDGDALGSVCATSLVLEKIGKQYTAFIPDQIVRTFNFLPNIKTIKKEYGNLNNYDLVLTLDAADTGRFPLEPKEIEKLKRMQIINIDHHFAGEDFGNINIKEPGTSSTSELLVKVFRAARIEIDKQIATCLLTGILTDTHNFSNPATTISSLRIASDLMLYGAKIHDIVKYCFYNKSFLSIKFLGKIFDKLVVNKKYNIVISVVTLKDLEEVNEVDEDVTEGIAGFLNDMSDVDVILVLKEQEGGFLRGSLRTTKENIDVSRLAKIFGGGGHKKAAGFTISGNIYEETGKWKVK